MADVFEWDVYLSHSAADKDVVRELAHRLREDGLRVWLDEWILKPGDHFRSKIEEALHCTRTVILCMSKHYFASEWTEFERQVALSRDPMNEQRRFIPLRLDDAPIEGPLADYVYIDWRDEAFKDAEYEKLLQACRAEQPDFPTLDRLEALASPAEGAYFLSLTVAGLRCFGHEPQTLDMSTDGHRPARWTLLLGNNGTGKTTLLQVLAILGHGRGSPSIPTAIQRAPFERTTGDSTATTAIADVYHSRTLDARNKGETSRINAKFIGLSYDISRSVIAAPTCFGYGAARRMASGQLSRKSDPGPTASLFDDSVFLRNGEEWLLQLDYAASKAKPRSEMATRLKSRLKKVRQILVDLLPDVSDIRFSSDESSPSPQVEFKTPFGWVPLNGIAYGYQSLVAWCVDLASRMVDLYPESPDPVAEPAVVLIDEIELHLHPSWQRDLMSFLTERFPNTQFIASAHSPLVVQAAPSVDANIALLQRDGNRVVIRNDMESIRGWRIDQVLSSDLYGTGPRAPDIQKLIDERRRLLAKPKLKKRDKDRLDELDMEIGPLTPGETPEEIKTTQLLRDSLQLMQARMGAAKESS